MASNQTISGTLTLLSSYYPGQKLGEDLAVTRSMWMMALGDDEIADELLGKAITEYVRGNEKLYKDCNFRFAPMASEVRKAALTIKESEQYARIEQAQAARLQSGVKWQDLGDGYYRLGGDRTPQEIAQQIADADARYNAELAKREPIGVLVQ